MDVMFSSQPMPYLSQSQFLSKIRTNKSPHFSSPCLAQALGRDSQIEKEDHSMIPSGLQCEYEWDPPEPQLLLLTKLSDPS
jgi:hypothetical protein